MVQEPFLAGDDEVGRHGEEPVGPGLLGGTCVLDGEGRAVAGPGDDGNPSGGLLDGGGDREAELLKGQRMELARAAAGEDGGGSGVGPGPHVSAEDVEIDGAVRPERGHGEEERPGDSTEPGGKGG